MKIDRLILLHFFLILMISCKDEAQNLQNSQVSIDIKLYKKDSDTPIPFEYLSSGEQVIIGLILKMFLTEFYGNNLITIQSESHELAIKLGIHTSNIKFVNLLNS